MDVVISDICFFVDDMERSSHFYQEKIGLKIKRQDKWSVEFETGEATFAIRKADEFRKLLGEERLSNEGNLCIGAFQFDTGEEVKEYYQFLRDQKIDFVTDLVDWPWGARAAYFKDLNGFLWEIYAWVGTPYTW